jgi:hypothetical protein
MGTPVREEAEREGRLMLPEPMDVLKWSAVAFAICLEILVVIAIVLVLFGVY